MPKNWAFAAIKRRIAQLPVHLRPTPTMVDVREGARLIGRRRNYVQELISKGRLASKVIEGVRLIPVSELRRLVRRRR